MTSVAEQRAEELRLFWLNRVATHAPALKRVRVQTPELCLIAVRAAWNGIEYVKDQTEELCLIAVRHYGLALSCVRNQTPAICLAAVQQNGQALQYVKPELLTPEIVAAAHGT